MRAAARVLEAEGIEPAVAQPRLPAQVIVGGGLLGRASHRPRGVGHLGLGLLETSTCPTESVAADDRRTTPQPNSGCTGRHLGAGRHARYAAAPCRHPRAGGNRAGRNRAAVSGDCRDDPACPAPEAPPPAAARVVPSPVPKRIARHIPSRAVSNQIVVAGALISGSLLLVAQRARPPELAGLWELPGGKVAAGESDAIALARELREELGVEVTVGATHRRRRGAERDDDAARLPRHARPAARCTPTITARCGGSAPTSSTACRGCPPTAPGSVS